MDGGLAGWGGAPQAVPQGLQPTQLTVVNCPSQVRGGAAGVAGEGGEQGGAQGRAQGRAPVPAATASARNMPPPAPRAECCCRPVLQDLAKTNRAFVSPEDPLARATGYVQLGEL